ncbi:MAG: AAA family ATPase, partial [Flavobacteriales bacterium]
QDKMVEQLLVAILSDGHVLLEGVPGIAKTLTAKLIAKTISVRFSRIQFTPDLMPSDVTGTSVLYQSKNEFEFRKGPIFSNIVLIDEINRAPAKTQAALFESMEERQVTVDGQLHELPPPFIVLATQNPVEQEGTYQLPEAQLDRFFFKIEVDYPTAKEEIKIINDFHNKKNKVDIENVKPVLSADKIREYRELVSKVHVDESIIKYISDIIQNTREQQGLFLGASPRASLAVLSGAKSLAAIRGRDFVTPEDIKIIVYPVLKHRLILTPEKEMEGAKPRDLIEEVIENIEVPR